MTCHRVAYCMSTFLSHTEGEVLTLTKRTKNKEQVTLAEEFFLCVGKHLQPNARSLVTVIA